ncbi:DNA excision repair protein ERCC-5-like [Branchiostoma floridae x Branchiostoma japonicum]
MGVHDLWKLLEPTGRPVRMDTLEGKVLAVDVSIWLNQAVMGSWNPRGGNKNPHLKVLFNRICKLLFYRIKPVFVFDGRMPELKRKTLAARRKRKEAAEKETRKVANKVLQNYLKVQALRAVRGETGAGTAGPVPTPQLNKPGDSDLFELPPLPEQQGTSANSTEADVDLWEERQARQEIVQTEFQDITKVDVESEDFKALPPDIQHEIIMDLQEMRKRHLFTLAKHVPEEADSFSNMQLSNLLSRSKLSQRLGEVRKDMNMQASGAVSQYLSQGASVESRRVVSEDTAHYLLVKGVGKQEREEREKEEKERKEKEEIEARELKERKEREEKERKDNEVIEERERKREESEERKKEGEMKEEKKEGESSKEKSQGSKRHKLINYPPFPKHFLEHLRRQRDSDVMIIEDGKGIPYHSHLCEYHRRMREPDLVVLEERHVETNADSTHSDDVMFVEERPAPESWRNERRVVNVDLTGAPVDLTSDSDEDVTPGRVEHVAENVPNSIEDKKTQEITGTHSFQGSYEADVNETTKKEERLVSDSNVSSTTENTTGREHSSPNASASGKRTSQEANLEEAATKRQKLVTDSTVEGSNEDVFDKQTTVVKGESEALQEKKGASPLQDDSPDDDKKICSVEQKSQTVKEENRDEQVKQNVNGKVESPSRSRDSSNKLNNSGKQDSTEQTVQEDVVSDNRLTQQKAIPVITLPEPGQYIRPPRPELQPPVATINIADSDEEEEFVEVTVDPRKPEVEDELFPASVFQTTESQKARTSKDDSNNVPSLKANFDLLMSEQGLRSVDRVDKKDRLPDPGLFAESLSSSRSGSQANSQTSTPSTSRPHSPTQEQPPAWEGLTPGNLAEVEQDLQTERRTLQAQQARQEKLAASITEQMYVESQELLRLFGIPYVQSPTEAEAQCAFLDQSKQTEGTITDDSDVWLFGGRQVYKNFFSQQRDMEVFKYKDVVSQLAMDRSRLINFALLTGSDYTEGIQGVGKVLAMEVLQEFPGEGIAALQAFRAWWDEAQKQEKIPQETPIKAKLRKLELSPGFPNITVVEAYLSPTVDQSKEPFAWGAPDLQSLRQFAMQRFGWTTNKTDEVLLPVMKGLKKIDDETQSKITSFFPTEAEEKRKIKSKRIRRVVNNFHRKEGEEDAEEESKSTTGSPVAAGKGAWGKGKGRGKGKGKGKGKAKAAKTVVVQNANLSEGSSSEDDWDNGGGFVPEVMPKGQGSQKRSSEELTNGKKGQEEDEENEDDDDCVSESQQRETVNRNMKRGGKRKAKRRV